MKPYCLIPLVLAIGLFAQTGYQPATGGPAGQASSAALDRMVTQGKSPQELAQYLFDTQGCKQCHTIGHDGKLGYTKEGEAQAQGFQGCIATLKAMSVIAKVPDDQRSATQRQRARHFEEFGCSTCHEVASGQVGLTELGAKLSHLHLGCVDIERLMSSKPAAQH